jgi:hypothetical protein
VSQERDRDFVQAVRAELAAIDPPRSCCRAAERLGLGAAARGRARSPAIARLAVRLAEPAPRPGHPAGEGRRVVSGHAEADRRRVAFDWGSARSHCRTAWLRGRFLAVASLSLGARGAHLEMVVPLDEGDALARRLDEAGFPAGQRVRRGRAVLTWKRTETVLALLRHCGASASVLEVESRLVMRHLQGHLNRVLNAETANLERTVTSSARQIAMIEQLASDGRLAELPTTDGAVARERRAAPEATFTELATRLGLSRARVQRAFRRIEAATSTPLPMADL